MSAEAVTLVLHHSQAEGTAKLVLWGIANHHSDSGAWPSIATLAKYANIKERRVQQIIRQLAETGELVIEEQGGLGQGQYKTNRYWITIQCPDDCDGSMNHRTGVQSLTAGVQSVTARGAIPDTSGVQPTAPELNKELNKNLNRTSYRLPEDWQPREEDISVMGEHFPEIDLKLETHAFRDYWASVPGTKGKKSDWNATWRNWIRNTYKRTKGKTKPKTDWDELDRWAKEQDENNAD